MAVSLKYLRVGLQLLGALSLIIVVVATAWIAYHWSPMSERRDIATAKDALFVLNWGGIPTDQEYSVISSYQSSRNITGDHVDYYCIQLSRFSVADHTKEHWKQGPETNPVFAQAVKNAIDWARQSGGGCVPSAEQANSPAMKILLWSVVTHSRMPTAANVLLYDQDKNRLYFIGYKT